MRAVALSTWLARRNIHYAWLVVGLAFLTMLSSAASLSLPGALLLPLSREFGWNADQVSSALAIRFALFGLIGPFAAGLMARYSVRAVVCTSLVMVSVGGALATQVNALWQLVLLWGVGLGIATGMTALVLAALVSTRWFEQRRGLVVGLLTASNATGQLVFLPVGAWMIEHWGWRSSVWPPALFCLLTASLVFLFMRDRPEDLGLAPYGAQSPTPVAAAAPPRVSLWAPITVLRAAVREPAFWILSATFFICGLSTNGLVQTHFISLCSDFGLSAVPAASVLAMMGMFDLIGTIASGWLSDRYDTRKLLFWYYSLRGLSLFWLPHSEFTLVGLSLFAMFYGLDWIATVPPTVKLTGQVFGKEKAAMVFGWIFAAHQLGAASAAYGAGLVRAVALSYTPSLYVAGGACLLAAALVFGVGRWGAKVARIA